MNDNAAFAIVTIGFFALIAALAYAPSCAVPPGPAPACADGGAR